MMFKRKEARKVSVGDICVLDENVKTKLRSSDRYLANSACHSVKYYGGSVNSSVFSKFNKRYLFEDVSLFYVKRKSIFGVLEIVPLFFDERQNGFLSKKSINDEVTMLSNAKSLEICSKSKLDGILEDYYPSVVDSARRYLSNSFYLENPWDID
jgi:hypothetical protein